VQTRVVNRRYQEYDVYIGRGSKWGNPYTHIKGKTKAEFLVSNREESIEKYEEWIRQQPELLKDLHELKGKRLGCYCRPHKCHGDILVELIEELEGDDFWNEF
jgi:hypothetical protein